MGGSRPPIFISANADFIRYVIDLLDETERNLFNLATTTIIALVGRTAVAALVRGNVEFRHMVAIRVGTGVIGVDDIALCGEDLQEHFAIPPRVRQ
jgi:hypothetical protein